MLLLPPMTVIESLENHELIMKKISLCHLL